jgi:hypothetical protein
MFEINENDLKKAIEALKEQRQKVDNVITPFLSKNLSSKQIIELSHVGKFLTLLNHPSHIITQTDSPDFIISYNGEKVGLEHERIFKADKVEMIKSVSKLFNDAAETFKLKYPNYNILAECWLSTSNFKFKKNETDKLKNEISDFIYSLLTHKNNIQKPLYIDSVQLMKHSEVSFCFNPGGYVVSDLDKQSLEKAILKKELLLEKYKVKSGLEKQWLLIVIGSASPDTYELGDNPFTIDLSSKFDRVYLMEDLNAKAWQIL